MFKRYIVFFSIIVFFSHHSHAQVQTGGNVGINILNNVLIIDFAPEVGYSFIKNTVTGISPFVLYAHNLNTNASETLFGCRAFGEYKTDFGLFAHAEYEISRLKTTEGLSKVIHSAPIGGGYETPLSDNTVAYIMVLYDILYTVDYSFKQNPIIRAGIRYSF